MLYLTDGPGQINEIGSTIDFLAGNNRMPPLIVVGIANTDRTRDLTPSHSDDKNADGTVANPRGGGDRFFDFIKARPKKEVGVAVVREQATRDILGKMDERLDECLASDVGRQLDRVLEASGTFGGLRPMQERSGALIREANIRGV